MKKVFFVLTFMLVGTFSFANNGIKNNNDIASEKISQIVMHFEEKEKVQVPDKELDCVAVNFCGTQGFLCGAQSLEQLFDWIYYYNDFFCD